MRKEFDGSDQAHTFRYGSIDFLSPEGVPLPMAGLRRITAQCEADEQAFHDTVAPTGKLSPIELNGIRKAGKIRARQKGEEYLNAVQTNPAMLIQSLLENDPGSFELNLLDLLNEKIQLRTDKFFAKSLYSYPKRTAREYFDDINSYDLPVTKERYMHQEHTAALLSAEEAMTRMGISWHDTFKLSFDRPNPPRPPQLCNDRFLDLFGAVDESDPNSRAPAYYTSRLSGLEGITIVSTKYANVVGRDLSMYANPETWAKIIDADNYIPYQPPKRNKIRT